MQLPFFRDYFYDAAVELLVESPPDVELEGDACPSYPLSLRLTRFTASDRVWRLQGRKFEPCWRSWW